MIDLSSQHVQLVIVDILFLGVALGILMWFRSWLRVQTRRMDRRFDMLDANLKQLTQVQERLQGACRTLTAADPRSRGSRPFLPPVTEDAASSVIEPSDGPAVSSSPVRTGGGNVANSARQHEIYERARQLLSKGISTDEVARMVNLGVAEVEVLKRMGELARSSSR